MRVLLVGTSNSIVRGGYRSAFEDEPSFTTFTHKGIGASPSVILPYLCAEINFRDYDYVVIDTAINDGTYHARKWIREDQIYEYLRWVATQATQARCKPVFLIMPTKNGLSKRGRSEVIYHKVAAEFRASVVNGYDFVRAHQAITGSAVENLFTDVAHLVPHVARLLGGVVIEKIKSLKSSEVETGATTASYTALSASEMGVETHLIESSLMRVDAARLRDGDSAVVSLGAGNAIVGACFNATKTWGYLNLAGNNAISKVVTTKYSRNGGKLLAVMFPFLTAIKPDRAGNVTVSISNVPRHEFEHHKKPPAPSGGAEVEVIGFLSRRIVGEAIKTVPRERKFAPIIARASAILAAAHVAITTWLLDGMTEVLSLAA